jgi:hypothetical protein
LALFSVTVLVLLVRVVWALIVERNFQVVDQYAGGQTLENEIEEVLSDKEVTKLEGTS